MQEESAFRDIVETNKTKIYYLALNLTRNHEEAEDLSQEVFMRAYRSLDQFRQDAHIGTWLSKIAVNAYIDKTRRKQLTILPMYSQEDDKSEVKFEPESASAESNPEKVLDSNWIQKHIDSALKRLSAKERSVFVLKHYEQFTIKEVAHVIKTTEGTVKSLLFRATRKLQKSLAFYREELGLKDVS